MPSGISILSFCLNTLHCEAQADSRYPLSINLIVVSGVELLIWAIVFLRLIQQHFFFELTMMLVNVYCLLHLLAMIIFDATYFRKLNPSDERGARGDICHAFGYDRPCTVDSSYIADFLFTCLNLYVSGHTEQRVASNTMQAAQRCCLSYELSPPS